MATNINGIIGYNDSGGSVNKILAAVGNDIVDVDTGLGYGLNLNGNNVEFENFMNQVFMQNYNNLPKTFDNTGKWTTKNVSRTMIAKFIKSFKSRSQLFLGNCIFSSPQAPLDNSNNALSFPSHVFFADFFSGSELTWGIEWGRNGRATTQTNVFDLDPSAAPLQQDFILRNIKVGDPLFITNGPASLTARPYFVSSIENQFKLILTETLPVSATGLHFWVGSNWFTVATDDNDQITGFGDNSDRFLISKLYSLWFYTGSQLRQVKNALGTSSQRSLLSYGQYTYYFHGSQVNLAGIYRYDGVQSVKISRAIDPFIRGMDVANYSKVVSWQEGDEIRFYLGNIVNARYGINITNAVATYHSATNAWDVGPVANTIVATTKFKTNNEQDIYCATDDDSNVQEMQTGNSFNGSPIKLRVETKVYYPSGTDLINDFMWVQVISRNAAGLKIKYKLWDKPFTVDDEYQALGEISADKTEFIFPAGNKQASGVQFMLDEIGVLKNDAFIEKITIGYKPITRRTGNG